MTRSGSGRMEDVLSEFRDRSGVAGVGGAVVDRVGSVRAAVAGSRRRDCSDPVTIEDQWHIGSCAKAITAALYARLVEAGITRWEVPVYDLFPDLAAEIDAGWSTPTIDDIFACRAGISPNLTRRQMRDAWNDTRPLTEQRTRAVVAALSSPPREHRTFRYSNLSYIVAGAAIDRLANIAFEDALHFHLFEPLGVTSAGYGPPPQILGHRCKLQLGSLCVGRGAAAAPGDPRSDNPAVMASAGRLHLKLADWATLHRLFIDGCGVLGAESIERLITIPPGKNTMAMGWAAAAKLDGASYGMQGSNSFWAATALINSSRDRTSMVVTNDGRTRTLTATARLAAQLFTAT